jgi:acyl-CoA oxidase
MMHIRELISCAVPKLYTVPIIIGARYSLFRQQFRNGKKEEVTIMDYQTQQDKVLPRIAEYYALCAGGNKIREGSEKNFENILHNDFTLLQ